MDPFLSISCLDYLVQSLAFKYYPDADGLQMYVPCPDVSPGLQTHLANHVTGFLHSESQGASQTQRGTPRWRARVLSPTSSSLSQSLQLRKQLDHLSSGSNPENSTVNFDSSLVRRPTMSVISRKLLPISAIPSWREPSPLFPGLPQALDCASARPHCHRQREPLPNSAQTLALLEPRSTSLRTDTYS